MWQAFAQGSHSFTDKKSRTFQDTHEKFSRTFFGAHKCLNIKKEARKADSGDGILEEGAASPLSTS